MKERLLKEKTRKCKYVNCKQSFVKNPSKSIDYCCSVDCYYKHAIWLKEQKEQKEIKEKHKEYREKTKTNSDYIKITQQVFNKYIRLRDQQKPCISCDAELTGKYDAGHYFSCGAYPNLRFHEHNVFGQCVACNQHKHGNIHEYRIRLLDRIGAANMEELKQLRNQPRKYTTEELKELISVYKQKTKELSK